MAKGGLVDPFDAARSDRPGPSKSTTASIASSSRTSVLASVVPMLRRHSDDVHKAPILTLKLSSTSFLDTTVNDDVTDHPLYTITTFGPTTTIKRADPWDGDTKTAEIRWSKTVPAKGKNMTDGVSISMRGIKWKGSETLLRRGTLTGSSKFNIPNYAQSLKWKRQGNAYWCTTAAVKGPIAILRPAMDSSFSTFEIFETLYDKNDARPMLVHHGVSTLLLDYLLITALFLVTDAQEWTQVQGADITIPIGNVPEVAGLSPPKSAPGNFSTSNTQWRKIMYGEPIFRGRSSASLQSSVSSSEEPPTPIPISPEQMAKVEHGQPIYPTRRSASPAISISESEGASEHMFFSPTVNRPHSPASESIFSPISRSAAPGHTYLDPSFYSSEDVPPVPSIPTHINNTSEANPSPRLRPSSSHSITHSNTRRLPEIPVLPPVPPLVPRPRSTPPRPRTSQSLMPIADSPESGPSVPAQASTTSATPRRPTRQLPRPPQTPAQPAHTENMQPPPSGLGRARSQSQSHPSREKWRSAAYSQRTLPSPPTSSSRGGIHPSPLQLQRVLSEDGRFIAKDVDDDWDGAAEPNVGYDMPPPAYNSINFSPTDSPLQSPASPMRREL